MKKLPFFQISLTVFTTELTYGDIILDNFQHLRLTCNICLFGRYFFISLDI